MKQYYLLKQRVTGQPPSVRLAEKYVEDMVTTQPWFLTPLGQVITVLANLKLDSKGEIRDLSKKVNKFGKEYYCIESNNYPLPDGGKTKYEILKKLHSKDHVYEIRIKIKNGHNDKLNCRILMTINYKKPYFVWTYGFTKQKNIFWYGNMKVNKLTDVLATVSHRVFNAINLENDEEYIGKVGERNEV